MSSSSKPPCQRNSLAEHKISQTVWHRVQRSALYTRFMPPIDMSKGMDTFISFCPIFFRPSDFGNVTIRLDAVKQGTWRGAPGTLLRLEIVNPEEYRLRQTAFKIMLKSSHTPQSGAPASIVAFGPGRISKPHETDRYYSAPAGTIPHIEIRQQDDCLMMQIEDYTRPRGFPISAHIGLVIVHETPAQLSVVPSTSRKGGAAVCRKSRVYPLDIDLTTAFNDLVTCGKDGASPCSDGCAEFGPEHMTSAVWDELLKHNRFWDYRAEEPGSAYVRYAVQ